MKRRRWDSTTKTKIVLEGLSRRPVSEIFNELRNKSKTNTTSGVISS